MDNAEILVFGRGTDADEAEAQARSLVGPSMQSCCRGSAMRSWGGDTTRRAQLRSLTL